MQKLKQKTINAVPKDYAQILYNEAMEILDKKAYAKPLIAYVFLGFLTGARVSEVLAVNEIKQMKLKDAVVYYVELPNLKQRKEKKGSMRIYPFLMGYTLKYEVEKKMFWFVKEYFDNSIIKTIKYGKTIRRITRYKLTKFLNKFEIQTIGFKDGKEMQGYLDFHTMRHLRARLLLEYGVDANDILYLLNWTKNDMLYYYVDISMRIKTMQYLNKIRQMLENNAVQTL